MDIHDQTSLYIYSSVNNELYISKRQKLRVFKIIAKEAKPKCQRDTKAA